MPAGMDEEGVQKTLGELLAANRATQANFDEIRQQFPIQPDNTADAIPDWSELEEGGLSPPEGEGEGESFAEQLGILGALEAFAELLWVEVGEGGAILRGGAGLTVEHPEVGVYKIWLQTATQEDFDYPGDLRECLSSTAGESQATNANVNLIESPKGVLGYEVRLVENLASSTLTNADFIFFAASLGTDGALAGAEGPAGPTHKTLYHGEGAPSAELGDLDDFYIDTKADAIYGPKGVEGWGAAASLIGPEGPVGPEGKEGKGGQSGFRYIYSSTTTFVDPGEGNLRFNAAVNLATTLSISETDHDGNALAPFLATLDDSTNTVKGTIILRKEKEPTVFAIFNVTGSISDKGTWDSLSVTYVTGALSNGDEVVLQFYRAGDKGPNVLLESEDVIEWKQEAKTLREKIRGYYDGVNRILELIAGEGEVSTLISKLTLYGGGSTALARIAATVGATTKTLLDGQARSHFMQLSSVRKVVDFGRVEALPGSPAVGDRCRYVASKAQGVVWDFEYDGEGEYPWKKVGGPSLLVEEPLEVKTKKTVYQTASSPSVNYPLSGDYQVTWGCASLRAAIAGDTGFLRVGYHNNGVLFREIVGRLDANGGESLYRKTVREAAVAGQAANARYKNDTEAAGETVFEGLFIEINPIRVK
jgi:hypothetical protein